jgi:hypothetical protein
VGVYGVRQFGCDVAGAEPQLCTGPGKVLLASALSLLNVLLLTHSQLIQEFRLALWLGRTLALPSEELVSCKRHIEFKADGRIQQLQVSWECQQLSAAGCYTSSHFDFIAG